MDPKKEALRRALQRAAMNPGEFVPDISDRPQSRLDELEQQAEALTTEEGREAVHELARRARRLLNQGLDRIGR